MDHLARAFGPKAQRGPAACSGAFRSAGCVRPRRAMLGSSCAGAGPSSCHSSSWPLHHSQLVHRNHRVHDARALDGPRPGVFKNLIDWKSRRAPEPTASIRRRRKYSKGGRATGSAFNFGPQAAGACSKAPVEGWENPIPLRTSISISLPLVSRPSLLGARLNVVWARTRGATEMERQSSVRRVGVGLQGCP